jgi:hypothetical protein
MARAWVRISGVVLASLVAGACTSTSSATDLHPEGPPMIRQVRLVEVAAGGVERTVFGFGTHPQASPDDAHPVTAAKAAGNKLRVIIDELLVGNSLEEIECRFPVDRAGASAFARVPVGATPDDIARCSVAQDLLASQCPGSNRRSVCLCQRDAGCPAGFHSDGTPNVIGNGESVGVKDQNQDGAADSTRFIAGAVGIACGPTDAPIEIPINLDASYWTPSGNQLPPVQGGFDALGPAIVVVPGAALPTSLACGLTFSPDVVDRDGNPVCAPPDGDLARGCAKGDVSAFTFTVQPLAFSPGAPVLDRGQPRTADIRIAALAPLDPASLANIAITSGEADPFTSFTATLTPDNPGEITLRWTSGELAADTRYTITVPTTVTDAYHQHALQPFQLAFTTGAL